jgi:hypothetical protein
MATTYTLSSRTFYDSYNTCYKNIYVVDRKPTGPLANIVKTLQTPKLSPFKQDSACCPINNCISAIYKPSNPSELLPIDQIAILFTFLTQNGYTIDTSLTKMMNESDVKLDNRLVCFISY